MYTTPACIDWNAQAAVVQANLASLTGIDGVMVERVGDASETFDYGYEYTVTFNGPYTTSGNMEQLTFSTAGCVAFDSVGSAATQTITTLVEGIAGAEQEVTKLVTDSDSQLGGQ